MRRRLAMLLSATLVAGIAAVLVPASPASAGVHVCAGTGTAALTQGLTYPVTVGAAAPPAVPLPPNPHPVHVTVTQQPRTTGFSFTLGVGTCVNSNVPTVKPPPVTATGTVSGWCGLSSGTGSLLLGTNPRFAWIGIGGLLVITGGVAGVVNAIPNTLAGQSCNNSIAGANSFLVQGLVVAYDHCNPATKHLPGFEGDLAITTDIPPGVLQSTLISGPLGTPLVLVSIHAAGTWHIWTKLCVPRVPPPLIP